MNPFTKIEIYVSGVQAVGWANMAIYQVENLFTLRKSQSSTSIAREIN